MPGVAKCLGEINFKHLMKKNNNNTSFIISDFWKMQNLNLFYPINDNKYQYFIVNHRLYERYIVAPV